MSMCTRCSVHVVVLAVLLVAQSGIPLVASQACTDCCGSTEHFNVLRLANLGPLEMTFLKNFPADGVFRPTILAFYLCGASSLECADVAFNLCGASSLECADVDEPSPFSVSEWALDDDSSRDTCRATWGSFENEKQPPMITETGNDGTGVQLQVQVFSDIPCNVQGNDSNRTTRFDLSCNREEEAVLRGNQVNDCLMQVTIETVMVCPESDLPDDGGGMSGVATFFLVVFILTLVFCMMGCGYKYSHMNARGADLLPFIDEYRRCFAWCGGRGSDTYAPLSGAGAGARSVQAGPTYATRPGGYHDQL